jgi:hypothetical protein
MKKSRSWLRRELACAPEFPLIKRNSSLYIFECIGAARAKAHFDGKLNSSLIEVATITCINPIGSKAFLRRIRVTHRAPFGVFRARRNSHARSE